jgi:hypothetical protein
MSAPAPPARSRASSFRQRDLEKAIRAVRATGGELSEIVITPDGSVRLIVGAVVSCKPNAEAETAAAFDQWLAKHGTTP